MSHSVDEDTLMEDESHHAVADVLSPVGSDPSGFPGGFEPSARLRSRIEKLAHWRIHPASLSRSWNKERESHGGHATVSMCCMDTEKMDMRDMEERALGKKLAGKAMDDFLKRARARIVESKGFPDVAVKKMRVADDTDFERILGLAIREAEFLAELYHPNIVELEGFVEDLSEGIIWLVFPWSDHGNLKDFLASEEWKIPERISLVSDVAKGLEYMHTRSPPICHGDLKSLNVLIYGEWDGELHRDIFSARITDFGSARRLRQRDPNPQIEEMVSQLPSTQPPRTAFCASTNTITLTGNKYTLRWAAPELLLEDQLSLWSDIWALGWITYEVMTGSLPFEDVGSDIVVVERVLEGKLPSLADNANLLLFDELCSFVNTCWEMQPSKRPTAGSCRRTIGEMPMLAPELNERPGIFFYQRPNRFFNYERLTEMGHMYQSMGSHARAFAVLVEALRELDEIDSLYPAYDGEMDDLLLERIGTMRDIARLARLSKADSATTALYDLMWKTLNKGFSHMYFLIEAFRKLTKQPLRGNEGKEAREIDWDDEKVQVQKSLARALLDEVQEHRKGGDHSRAILLYTEALTISVNLGDEEGRADALRGLAEVCRLLDEYEEAITLYSRVLEIRTDLGDREGRADAMWGLATVYRLRCEYDEAITLYSQVLEIRTGLGDRKGTARALWRLADTHTLQGEYEQAITFFSKDLEIRTDLGDQKGKANAIWGLAEARRLQGEYEQAITFYSKDLEMRTELGDKEGRADAIWGLATVHVLRCEYNDAITLYSKDLEIRTDLGDREGRADALWGLAEAHRLQGEYEQAMTFYSKNLEIRTDLGNKKCIADALWGLAEAHRLRGEYEQAITLYSKELEIRTDLGDREGRADALWGLAEAHRLRGEYEQAMTFYSKNLEIRTDLGDKKCTADALWGLAEAHRLRGEYEQAITIYSKELEIRTDLGDREGRADALWGLAEAHRLQGEYEQAISFYSKDLEMRTDLGDSEGLADSMWGLATVYRLRCEYGEAITLYYQTLEIRAHLDDRKGTAEALRRLADTHRLQGEYMKATDLYSEFLEIHTDVGDRKSRATVLGALGDVYRLRSLFDMAIRLYSELLEIRTDLGDQNGRATASLGLARVYRDQHCWGDAACLYQQAAEIAKEVGNDKVMAIALRNAANARQRLLSQEVARDPAETLSSIRISPKSS